MRIMSENDSKPFLFALDHVTIVEFKYRTIDEAQQKTYLWTCASSKDSDQPVHSRINRISAGRVLDSQGCKFSSCENEDPDQTARM